MVAWRNAADVCILSRVTKARRVEHKGEVQESVNVVQGDCKAGGNEQPGESRNPAKQASYQLATMHGYLYGFLGRVRSIALNL